MKKRILKYQIEKIESVNIIQMIKGAQILTAQNQNGILTLWCVTYNDEKLLENRIISIYGTGHVTNDNIDVSNYISTVQMGLFVWHVYELC